MHVQELDSIRLLKLCGTDQDNYDAWQELSSRFSGKIKMLMARSCQRARKKYRYLSSQISVIPAQEVDDLSQELWLRLAERDGLVLKRFRGETEEQFCAYLAALAQSIAENHYRDLSRKKRPHIEHSLESLAEMEAGERFLLKLTCAQTSKSIEECFLERERIEWLYATVRARNSSPEDSDKAVIIIQLYFLQGLTADEISRCKDIQLSRRAVTKLISRVRCYVTQYVRAHGPELEPYSHNSCL